MAKKKIELEDLHSLLLTVVEKQVKFDENLSKVSEKQGEQGAEIGDLHDMMQIMINSQNKLEDGQNRLISRVISLEEKVNENIEDVKELKSSIKNIQNIVEKDAKDQDDHKIEHISNIAAHDRFEARIATVEGKVGVVAGV